MVAQYVNYCNQTNQMKALTDEIQMSIEITLEILCGSLDLFVLNFTRSNSLKLTLEGNRM